MRSICLYFQVHQPFRLRTYRFFDIGDNHHYYDEYLNRSIIRRVAENCYIPANNILLKLIKEYGQAFRVSFSLSGTAIEQMERYSPEALEGFKKLAKTGCVEFLAETYSHSLSSLQDKTEFRSQVEKHAAKIESVFGLKPVTFRNSELIYSDSIGQVVADMGYTTMLTEGAKHVLGWKSPNYLYCNAINPKLKVLLKNFQLSDDLAFRFSNKSWSQWPLTAEKYLAWLNDLDKQQEVVNLFIDYVAFGERQKAETGILEFLKVFPGMVIKKSKFTFNTPSELGSMLQPISAIHVPYPISWADEERDITAWLGNELQKEAYDKLYAIAGKAAACSDPEIRRDWEYLQTSDHFYYMSTKWFSDGDVHRFFNPYDSPYEAFINYMNVLSDFTIRVNSNCGEYQAPVKEHITEVVTPPVKKIAKAARAKKTTAKTKK